MTRWRRWAILAVLAGLYLGSLGVLGGIITERVRFDAIAAPASASPETETERRPSIWRGYLEMVDAALARRDVTTAVRAWREAHAAALRTRAWRPLVEVGDALIRIADVDGRRPAYVAQARKTYLAALVRARADRSVDGALRIAEAFSVLGDQPVVDECLIVAERLGAPADHEVIVRLRALTHAVDAGAAPRLDP